MDTFNKYSKEKSLEYCVKKYQDVFPREIENIEKVDITFGGLVDHWLEVSGKRRLIKEDLVDFLQYTAIKANEQNNESILQHVGWYSVAYIKDLSLVDWLIDRNAFEMDDNDFAHILENDYKFKIPLTQRLLDFNDNECIFYKDMAFEASSCRDWEFLTFLLKNKCPTNISVYGPPALDGNIEVLQMLKDNHCSFKPHRQIEPFSNATPEAIEWFTDNMESEEILAVERRILKTYSLSLE